jgi:hypothetical protein
MPRQKTKRQNPPAVQPAPLQTRSSATTRPRKAWTVLSTCGDDLETHGDADFGALRGWRCQIHLVVQRDPRRGAVTLFPKMAR